MQVVNMVLQELLASQTPPLMYYDETREVVSRKFKPDVHACRKFMQVRRVCFCFDWIVVFIPVCVPQSMETNSEDVLEEGESVDKFVQITVKGKGMTERARVYVRPIAVRYVRNHMQYLFQVQSMRRSEGPIDDPPVDMSVCESEKDDLFDGLEWVKELDNRNGTWRNVTLFRHVSNKSHVCMWFGGVEYEGIDPVWPYTYCPDDELLQDDEGYDINWRVVGADHDSDDSDIDSDSDEDI